MEVHRYAQIRRYPNLISGKHCAPGPSPDVGHTGAAGGRTVGLLVGRKILIFGILALLGQSVPSLAATRYVAVLGKCHAHAAVGTSFVSCADSRQNSCSASKACCTLQDALDVAAAGDTVEIHDGVFTVTAPGFTDVSAMYSCSNATYMARANQSGLVITAATNDKPVFDLGQVTMGGLLVVANGVTVAGLQITNGGTDVDSCRVGGIHVSRYNYNTAPNIGVVLRNNVVQLGYHPNAVSANTGIKLAGADNFLVENNTVTGDFEVGIDAGFVEDGTVGGIVRGNTVVGFGRQGASGKMQTFLCINHAGSRGGGGTVAVYNNVASFSSLPSLSKGIYLRENHMAVYVFNNIVNRWGSGGYECIRFQDDGCSGTSGNEHFHNETYGIFNNTCIGVTGNSSRGVYWPRCHNGNVRNNVFENYTAGARLDANACPVQICTVRDDNARGGADAFTNDLCWGTSSCKQLDGGEDVTTSALVTTADPKLDSSGRLQSGSGAIGTGTNNPLGQGAGLCTIRVASTTIDCSLDIDGQSRNSDGRWDIGADEFSGSAPSAPSTTQNLRRIDVH